MTDKRPLDNEFEKWMLENKDLEKWIIENKITLDMVDDLRKWIIKNQMPCEYSLFLPVDKPYALKKIKEWKDKKDNTIIIQQENKKNRSYICDFMDYFELNDCIVFYFCKKIYPVKINHILDKSMRPEHAAMDGQIKDRPQVIIGDKEYEVEPRDFNLELGKR